MLSFNLKYFVIFLSLLVVEIMIALFLHDAFVRPFVGDVIATIVVYCFLKSFLNFGVRSVALLSLVISYLIEIMQYFNFLAYSGLKKYKIIAIVLGSSFDWGDMLAYTVGFLIVLLFEFGGLRPLNYLSLSERK